MTVDLEAIARRQRCDASALRGALPLLEQGYEPPFLTRYRRDEIGNIPERALWELVSAVRTEAQLELRRNELREKYDEGELDDDALLASITEAKTARQLDRIARRIRKESGHTHPATRLAVRLLNPRADDPADLQALAVAVVGEEQAEAAIEGLESVLGQYLAADSRVLKAATEWMDRHVQLHVLEVSDPHEGKQDSSNDDEDAGPDVVPSSAKHESSGEAKSADAKANQAKAQDQSIAGDPAAGEPAGGATSTNQEAAAATDAAPEAADQGAAQQDGTPAKSAEQKSAEQKSAEQKSAELSPSGGDDTAQNAQSPTPQEGEQANSTGADSAAPTENAATDASAGSPEPAAQPTAAAESSPATPSADAGAASDQASESAAASKNTAETTIAAAGDTSAKHKSEAAGSATAKGQGKGKGKSKSGKDGRKKISPRQRRRKWLVSVLQPMKGKSLPKAKLTAFQVVMLGRALRSGVVECSFKYKAGEFVRELAQVAGGLNQHASDMLSEVVTRNEAAIREALEAAWWDDLIDRAARRLISVATESLRRQMHRQPIEADTILAIDAVGPRTAAVAVVGPDGQVVHTEDVACQLNKSVRQQMVTRLGELVHQYHVDLIVVSNGPARRSCMVALTELLSQSQGTGLRWTLAERAGAEIYAGGPEGNRELRSVPRRFRAAVWLCQSLRTPARALAKVDVGRLRLGSYQRELADKSLAAALSDVVTSGVCQLSVDVNAADRGWLGSLPGVTSKIAESIDRTRRTQLFSTRDELLALDGWDDLVAQRQAAGFLRVFAGAQPLDATAIHPDDYELAEKLMGRLEIPAPPSAPPGYEPPDYSVDTTPTVGPDPEDKPQFSEVKIADVHADKPFGLSPEGDAEATDSDKASGEAAGADASSDDAAGTATTAQADATGEATVTADAAEANADEASQPSEAGQTAEANQTAEGDSSSVNAESAATEAAESTQSEDDSKSDQSPASAEGTADAEAAPDASSSAADSDTAEAAAGEAKSVKAASPPPYSHPLPELDKVSRLVKEWQIGEHRVRHIVRSLCQPFSDSGFDHYEPVATMSSVPKLADLKPGDMVCGVVVGVAGFGVFVELGPECSGLVHISRLSEDFVEDLNEFVQIGDVLTAWVVEIDQKRRRVSLSGMSPERHAQVKQERANRSGGKRRGGRSYESAGTGQDAGKARGGDSGSRRGGAARAGAGASRGGGRGGNRQDGGRGRGGGRRDGGRSKGPTTYTTVSRSDAPASSINDAQRGGDEPLRSFGELMQFYKGDKPKPPAKASQGKAEPPAAETPKPAGETPAASTPPPTPAPESQGEPTPAGDGNAAGSPPPPAKPADAGSTPVPPAQQANAETEASEKQRAAGSDS